MSEGGFYQHKTVRPGTMALVLAAHAAAIVALGTAKIAFDPPARPAPTRTIYIPTPIEPPPIPPERTPDTPQRQTESVFDRPPAVIPAPPRGPALDDTPVPPAPWEIAPPGPPRAGDVAPPRADPPAAPPAPAPVRTEADVDPRFARDLQPPYPPAEQRAGNEGTVVVQVTIGTDGRVKAVERVSAPSEAFWRVTERHARGHWRFRPATIDGRPVESRRTMTVHFRLTD